MVRSRKSEETPREDSIRILLVEDDSDQRGMLREILELRGFSVTVAGDGLEAEKIAAERTFDVVVSDIRLPGLDGVALARRLVQRDRPPKVILITAFPSPRTVELGYIAGAAQVLSKPFGLDKFTQLVEEAGRGRRREA